MIKTDLLKRYEYDANELKVEIIKENIFIKECFRNCKNDAERKIFAQENINDCKEFLIHSKDRYEFFRKINELAKELTGEGHYLEEVSLFEIDKDYKKTELNITKTIDCICSLLIKNINILEVTFNKLQLAIENLEYLDEWLENVYEV